MLLECGFEPFHNIRCEDRRLWIFWRCALPQSRAIIGHNGEALRQRRHNGIPGLAHLAEACFEDRDRPMSLDAHGWTCCFGIGNVMQKKKEKKARKEMAHGGLPVCGASLKRSNRGVIGCIRDNKSKFSS